MVLCAESCRAIAVVAQQVSWWSVRMLTQQSPFECNNPILQMPDRHRWNALRRGAGTGKPSARKPARCLPGAARPARPTYGLNRTGQIALTLASHAGRSPSGRMCLPRPRRRTALERFPWSGSQATRARRGKRYSSSQVSLRKCWYCSRRSRSARRPAGNSTSSYEMTASLGIARRSRHPSTRPSGR